MSVLSKLKRGFLLLGSIFLSLFLSFSLLTSFASTPVSAVPDDTPASDTVDATNPDDASDTSSDTSDPTTSTQTTDVCYSESGSLGWLVCPTTGFLAKVVDGIYGIIEDYLVINPLTSNSDSPFHQVWSIFRDITNIVFVIFFIIVIYSQLTGLGISNYGIKKVLPKIVIAAILINLSYIICAFLVDISNIVGSSLRGIFSSIEQGITPTGLIASASAGATVSSDLGYTALVAALGGGTILAGVAAGASGGLGYIFIALIPVLLGAVVAILIAYITVAARQALVYLLIMISPLAFVCYLLPNTEKWFASWKKSLTTMLFFYPLFATLFGACSLVGWVIIAAAETPLMLVLGIAVKVVPLFLAWGLLKMSGTLPGQVNSLLTNWSKRPLGAARTFFASEAALKRAKFLGEKAKPYQSSRRLAQFLDARKYRREADTKKYLEAATTRNEAFTSEYKDTKGKVTRRGRSLYGLQGASMQNKIISTRNAADFDEGLGKYAISARDKKRLSALDIMNRDAADQLHDESDRAEMISYRNAAGRDERTKAAIRAHTQSSLYGRRVDPEALSRYNRMLSTMQGQNEDVHFIGAGAAATLDVQQKIVATKFSKYFSSLPPTQQLHDSLKDLTQYHHSASYIDPIVSGLQVLNQRGDTDLVKDVIDRVLENNQIRLGTHASQSLANFLMFDVKGNDPLLRRYGKYINLETARVYNEGQSKPRRRNDVLSFDEYIKGEYEEIDEHGNRSVGKSKRSAAKLLEGTSLDDVERTAYGNIDSSLKKAYGDDVDGLIKKRAEIQNSLMPAFISAMLKYPSGSEQIVNASTWLTGLSKKGDVWEKAWEDPDSPLYNIPKEEFFKMSEKYLQSQTSSQVLNFRTDILEPILEIFAEEHEDTGSEKGRKLRQKLLEKLRLADADFSDANLTSDLSDKDKRRDIGFSRFRDLLSEKGTLAQIYETRNSGAANNAKPTLRKGLRLDDNEYMDAYLENVKKEKSKSHPSPDDAPDTPPVAAATYENHTYFSNLISKLFNNNPSDPAFFENTYNKVLIEFGLPTVARYYKDYHDAHPSATNEELRAELDRLLSNPDNY